MKTSSKTTGTLALLGLGLAVLCPVVPGYAAASGTDTTVPSGQHRMIVLTDIENEPDDTQSMVRLLLYSNVIELQGLIATTSTHLKTTVAPESILKVVEAYGKVRNNLLMHEPGFPTADALAALVKKGLPVYGMQGVGPGMNSEGSDWIVHVLEQDDSRPLWVSIWGGANTLAQALHDLRATRSEQEVRRLVAKLRVYTISDQDDSGVWIRRNFEKLFYIVSPGGAYGTATWGAINSPVDGIDNTTISNRWIAENIQQGHGPLGAEYPDVAWGMEGDTPSWLGVIPNGLNEPEHPDWGGWGGRYELYLPEFKPADPKSFYGNVPDEPETRPIWTHASDTFTPLVHGEFGRATRPGEKSFTGSRVTLWRWRDEFQNDFAARMDWTIRPYAEANHPPVPVLRHPDAITVKSGGHFSLDARDSSDPDGDSLAFLWFHYPEAGTFKGGRLRIAGAENMARTHVVAPAVEKPETVHMILKVTDRGCPPLSRYKRVIVTVTP